LPNAPLSAAGRRKVKVLLEESEGDWLVHKTIDWSALREFRPPQYELRGKAHHHRFHCVKFQKLIELEVLP